MQFPEIRLLHRTKLCEALRSATERFRLVVLSAPMGYGKTTVARELLPTLPQRTFYTVISPGMHTPHYLWEKTCIQLTAQGAKLAPTLLRRGFPDTPGERERAFDLIRAHLKNRPTVLVYDDYHYVHSQEMDDFYHFFVKADIAELSILIISRTRPGFPLEEFLLKGFAVQYGQDHLAFSREEARDFFALHGVNDPQVADQAWSYSEGWPSALWLALHSYLLHGVLRPDRSVEKLLESAVFAPYSDEDRLLLFKLSLMPRFSPRQAAFVLDDPSVPHKLMTLHTKNAFLNYDATADAYSLHSLFRTFLNNKLTTNCAEATPGVDIAAIHRRMAKWCEMEQDSIEALKRYSLAGTDEDLLDALRIFERPNDGHTITLAPDRIKAFFTSIPWPVRFRCPIGYLAFIYHYMSRVSIAEAIPLLEEAEQRFMNEPSIPEDLKRRIEGEIIVIQGLRAFNNIAVMHSFRSRAKALLPHKSSITHRYMDWNFGCPSISFLYLRAPGMYDDFLHRVQLHTIYYQELADGCSMGAQDLCRAEFHLEKGKLKQVEACVAKSIYRANAKDQRTTILCANFTLARLFIAKGTPERLPQFIADVDSQLMASATSLLAVSMELAKAYLYACLGRPDAIPAWLREGKAASTSNLYHGAPFAGIIQGKYLMLKKQWVHLEVFAQDLARDKSRPPHLFLDIHAKVMEAVAAFRLDGMERAVELLGQALNLARPDSLCLCISEYGKHIMSILRRYLVLHPEDAFADTVFRLAKRYSEPGSATDNPAPDSVASGLKERDATLLSLAAQGKSNGEIARHLKLSEAAIKKAFSLIYRKLHVRNRAEAVQAYLQLQE